MNRLGQAFANTFIQLSLGAPKTPLPADKAPATAAGQDVVTGGGCPFAGKA